MKGLTEEVIALSFLLLYHITGGGGVGIVVGRVSQPGEDCKSGWVVGQEQKYGRGKRPGQDMVMNGDEGRASRTVLLTIDSEF